MTSRDKPSCMKLSEFTCISASVKDSWSLPLLVELAFALFPHAKAFGCLTQKSGHDCPERASRHFRLKFVQQVRNPDASATKCLGLSKCKVCWKTDGHKSILHATTAKTCPSSPKIWPLGMTENWIKAIKAHAQARPYKSNFDWSFIASRIHFSLSLNQVYD